MQRGKGNPEPSGNNQHTSKEVIDDNVNNYQKDKKKRTSPTGNTSQAALRRLRKDRPDIHKRVLSGELSSNAGMVEAGFRSKTIQITVGDPGASIMDEILVVGKGLEIHKIALLIPEMDKEQFKALKEDISGLGVINPVVMFEGKILDGRHRYQACMELGIPCPTREWEGGMDPVEYVISENIHRRHLNQGQIAMIRMDVQQYFVDDAKRRQAEAGKSTHSNQYEKKVQLVAPVPQAIPEQEPARNSKTREKIGKLLNVGAKTVGDAQKVYNHGTEEEKKAVISGEKSAKKVAAEIRERKKAEPQPANKQKFNISNDNIEWARYTWNPVTGCKFGCPYCYARDIGMRFNGTFEPQFHPERLQAPKKNEVLKT